MLMKIHMPSLDHLRAFEAAARHLSFQMAAHELHVTPAAVSQRIRALELDLGQKLFTRLTRRVLLTEAGQAFAHDVRDGLGIISKGLLTLRNRTENNILTISTTTTLAEQWILPNLPDFNAVFPDYDVRIIATDGITNFNRENVDLAIRFGRGNYPGCHTVPVLEGLYIPVCARNLVEHRGGIKSSAWWEKATLIHVDWPFPQSEVAPTWTKWSDATSVSLPKANKNLRVTIEAHAIRAAILEQGVALVHQAHVQRELRDGRLVSPFGTSHGLTSEFKFFLVWPSNRQHLGVERFKDWIFEAFKY